MLEDWYNLNEPTGHPASVFTLAHKECVEICVSVVVNLWFGCNACQPGCVSNLQCLPWTAIWSEDPIPIETLPPHYRFGEPAVTSVLFDVVREHLEGCADVGHRNSMAPKKQASRIAVHRL
jgi:hypothetical protein